MKKILLLSLIIFINACTAKPTVHSQVTHDNIKIGKPYKVAGTWYKPQQNANYNQVGMASWYGPNFHGKKTANGETYNKNALTAAHKTLPLPSVVKVTNLDNNRSVLVRVNDRGPFVDDRIIDLSEKAATILGFKHKGVQKVRVQYLEKETNQFIADLKNDNLQANDIWLTEHENNRKHIKSKKPELKMPVTDDDNDNIINTNISKKEILSEENKEILLSNSNDNIQTTKSLTIQENDNLIFVQAGTFSIKNNAYNLVKKLAHLGSTIIIPVNKDNNTWYKVRFGPFNDMQQAQHLQDELLALGNKDAMIINDTVRFVK